MVSAVTGVTHTQPVAPITAVNRKPQQAQPQSADDIQDTVHLSSTAQAHLSALRAATQEAMEPRAQTAKEAGAKAVAAAKPAVRK